MARRIFFTRMRRRVMGWEKVVWVAKVMRRWVGDKVGQANWANMWKIWACEVGLYEVIIVFEKNTNKQPHPTPSPGCTSVFFTYPFDLIRVRLAFEVRSNSPPVKLPTIIRTIYHEPNPFLPTPSTSSKPFVGFLNFYRGFMPTLYGIIPYAG